MAKFRIEIEIDNAAFEDSCSEEVARILHGVADRIVNEQPCVGQMQHDHEQISLRDVNGNLVGSAWVK